MELYISRVKIHNYRSIQNAEFALREKNIIIGKNNIGKSNIIDAMYSFRSLKLEDINVDLLEDLWKKRQSGQEPSGDNDCIQLELTYHWKDLPSDYWFLLSALATEGETKVVVTYRVAENSYISFSKMKTIEELIDLLEETVEVGTPEDFGRGTQETISNHDIAKYLPTEANSSLKPKFKLFRIDAMRNTTQGKHSNQNEIGQTLAPQLAPSIEQQQDKISSIQHDVDKKLNASLTPLQSELQSFAYPHDEKAPLQAVWTIDEWLKSPSIRLAKVYDDLDKFEISLSHQGLGYQNIYNIIARLNNLFSVVAQSVDEAPVLIVIEEPEVFTHPQLQHVFIQQIEDYVQKHSQACHISTQLIIISHSPEVAVSALSLNFDLIIGRSHNESTRFINWDQLGESAGDEGVKSRNKLRKLVLSYNAELFFADKLLCYEGDGERLILGSLMRNRDKNDNSRGLMSEKVALLPVGTHFSGYRAAIADLLFDQVLLITDVDFHLKNSVKAHKSEPDKTGEPNKQKLSSRYWKFGMDEVDTIKTTNSNLALLTEKSDSVVPLTNQIDLRPLIADVGETLKDAFSEKLEQADHQCQDDSNPSKVKLAPGIISRAVGLTIQNRVVDLNDIVNANAGRLMIVTQGYLPNNNFWPRTLETALVCSSKSNFDLYAQHGLLREGVSWSNGLSAKLNEVETKLLASDLHKADFAAESLDILNDETFIMPKYLQVGLDWLVGSDE